MEFITSLAGIIAAVVIPVVIAIVGNAYTRAIREREIQGRLVELAIGILKELPDEKYREIRRWAVDVVDRYSGVQFPIKAKTDLIERVSLPTLLTPRAYRALARRLKSEKRYEEAVQAYLTAFELEPDDPQPLNYAGAILGKYRQKYDEAEELYNRALEVNPEYTSPIYNKACNEARRGNPTRALDFLQEAIGKDPKYRDMARRDEVFDAIKGADERRRLEMLLQQPGSRP